MKKLLERIAVALEEIAVGLNYLRRLDNELTRSKSKWNGMEKGDPKWNKNYPK